MAQSITTTLGTNATATTRTVCYDLRIGWGLTTWPSDWTLQATDETARLLSASWTRRLAADPLGVGSGAPAQLTLVLDNRDQRFSPFNESGPLYSNLTDTTTTAGGASVTYPTLYYTPVRLRMGFVDSSAGAEYVTVFSGYIDNQSDETYGLDGDQVTLTVLDRGAVLLQRKASCDIKEGWRIDQWLQYLVATLGGIAGGSYATGLTTIPFLWLDDENLWAETQSAAAAEAGYFFFDELGLPRFKNATWWLTDSDSTSSQTVVTTERTQHINAAYDWRTMSTGAIVEYQPRAQAGLIDVYTHNEPLIIPTEGYTFLAKLTYPCLSIADPTTPTDWYPVSANGDDLSASVTCTLSAKHAQRCQVSLTNHSNETAFVHTFRLRGLALIGMPSVEVEDIPTPSLLPYNKVQRYSGNAYIQTNAQASMLANLLARRMRYPRLIHDLRNVRALPWLQLGDRITVSAVEPYTAQRDAIITGLSFRYTPDDAFLMDIEAVDATALFEYTNYFTIGVSKYGGASVSGYGRVYI